MRDFTVPNGSRSSSAMAVWVLSSKNALPDDDQLVGRQASQ